MLFLGILFAIIFMFIIEFSVNKIRFMRDIKKINKKLTIKLDYKTNLSLFRMRYKEWLLTMFCDKLDNKDFTKE